VCALCVLAAHTATRCNMLQHATTYDDRKEVDSRVLFFAHTCKTERDTATQYTATYCNTLQHTAIPCMLLFARTCKTECDTATHCNTLQHTATHCNTLQYTAIYRNTPQYTACFSLRALARLSVTLQHTATHCNTLQYTAIHCNTPQYTAIQCVLLFARACRLNEKLVKFESGSSRRKCTQLAPLEGRGR